MVTTSASEPRRSHHDARRRTSAAGGRDAPSHVMVLGPAPSPGPATGTGCWARSGASGPKLPPARPRLASRIPPPATSSQRAPAGRGPGPDMIVTSGQVSYITRPKSSTMRDTRQRGLLQGIVILESSYARIFEMSRQSQPPSVVEDHRDDDAPQAADLLKGATERPILNCARAGPLSSTL